MEPRRSGFGRWTTMVCLSGSPNSKRLRSWCTAATALLIATVPAALPEARALHQTLRTR